MHEVLLWDVWYPKAASTGLPFARGSLAPTDVLLVHAAPDFITVEVRDSSGLRLAFGQDLPRTRQTPICRLIRTGEVIQREDIWPSRSEIGLPVLLPGGEAAILKAWWHAEDHKEWRWQIELYNSTR
jgi:hypothetical protein